MKRREINALAHRLRGLRPPVGDPRRRLWADMVNATTGTAIPETVVRDFREMAGVDLAVDRAGVVPELGDMRQGVTPAGHAVLDKLDVRRTRWANHPSGEAAFEDNLRQASDLVIAARSGDLETRRLWAIDAAARLIRAVEQIDEEIGS